jgi:hypothetical protein
VAESLKPLLCSSTKFALPDNNYSPTGRFERGLLSRVSFYIHTEFLIPVVNVRCWGCCVSATWMPMPETTMDKNRYLVFR